MNRLSLLLLRLLDPLSHALAPLMDGLLRRMVLRAGFREGDIRIDGVSLHYYHRPARPSRGVRARLAQRRPRGAPAPAPTPILLIHGLGDNALTWAATELLLRRDHDVYAIDLPGYGLSGLPPGQETCSMPEMRSLLAEFIATIIQRPALVVGNSMGGWIALHLAKAHPDLVREIVLINAGGAYLEGQPSWEPFRDVVAMGDLQTTRLAIRQILGLLPALAIYIGQRSIQDRFHRQVVRAFVAQADERDFLHPDELRELQTPVAIIWGMADRFLPGGSYEFFHTHLPQAPTRTLRRCGHLPQRERPLAVARFLDARAARYDRPR